MTEKWQNFFDKKSQLTAFFIIFTKSFVKMA